MKLILLRSALFLCFRMNKITKKRRKLGSRTYKDYSEDILELAVEYVKNNTMSSREAEKTFGIPRRTILNKVNKVHSKSVGGQTKLTDEEEEKLVNVLIASADYGSPMTKMDVKVLVYKYLEKNSRTYLFGGKLPSDTWVDGFLNRHRLKLTIRTTQNIKKVRAEKGLQEMEQFFDNLRETLKNVPPSNILNFDETNLSDNPGTSKCVFRRGVKHPERILNNTKSCISVMFTASAAGTCLPVYVVYKSTNLYSEWLEGGPDGTRYSCSKSGWFDTASFEDYFNTIIVPWAKQNPGPKVVIGDNLSSHINVEVVELCQKHDIRLVFLPPNSTHLTQPLDVAYFGPLKREWKKILLDYKFKNPGQTTLNKKHFPKLLTQLLENMKHREKNNILSGFRATGIWPLNPRNVFKRIPEIFDATDYTIDTALLEYLKETRAPNPMQVKRSKKLRTEPGKSVCADDISTKANSLRTARKKVSVRNTNIRLAENDGSEKKDTNKEKETEKKMTLDTENVMYVLNEMTGEVTRKTEAIKNVKQDVPPIKNISCASLTLKPQDETFFYNPDRLDVLCLHHMNMYFSSLECDTNTQSLNVCVINKNLKMDAQNQSFIAINENDLPKCLRPKTSKSQPIITSNKKLTPKELKKIINSIKVDTEVITQSALQIKMNKPTKKIKKQCKKKEKVLASKKNVNYSETSSEISENLSLAETDSEYESFDAYVSACLEEMNNKENSEPDNITVPFGFSNINYYASDRNFKKDDWIVVKFATKKSLKHFVGVILYIKNGIPTVKFTRKVKYLKQDKMIFTYPNVEDVCEVNIDGVETVLPKPNISRRGQIIFNKMHFNPYNIQ